ncbi:ABC transporter C family member 8 [Triticum urartu]|uniref:ABC transporter C family member 8 n=1 Tax=Triticum urartu TaxID=4572 RepID=M7ZYC3_TRIUA|nr:ABC transporter C family member 8 [Triticum urartu]
MERGRTPEYLLASSAACQGQGGGDLALELGSLCFISQTMLIDLVNLLLLAVYVSSLLIAACKREFRVVRARELPFPCAVASPCCALLGIACVCLGLGAWGSSPHGALLFFVRGFVWVSLSVSLVVRPTRLSGALAVAWWAVDAVLITANCLEKTVTGGNLGVLDVMSWAVGFLLLLSAIRVYRSLAAGDGGGAESEPLLAAGGGERRAAFGEAGFFSRLTFTWMDSLLRLGYSKPLGLGDIPPLDADDAAAEACRKFLGEWHRRRGESHKTSNLVLRVLAECHKKELLLTALYTLLRTLSFAASPLVLAIALLFWIVGAGALPALAPVAICGVLNVPFARMLQQYQSRFMQAQDERQRATAEVLHSMKIVKLQSWEDKFRATVQRLRDAEVRWLGETQLKKAYGSALYWVSPTVISAVVLAGTAAVQSAPLDAGVVFTVLATMRVVSEPMRMLPEVMSVMIQVKVSLDRIGKFLTEDEFQDDAVDRAPASDRSCLDVHHGVFSWEPSKGTATLKDINITATHGQKIAVCGPVGAGKSSLLCATLGEIPRMSGSVAVSGSVAYVSQTSWIQSGTVRDNILFGRPMRSSEYERALKCCALDKDMENFPHGDLTEIGQRGLNMSGGQKQRIQLARAVYSDADVYLLDDPFSAVDAHTAATLFNDCVMAAPEDKTVILVTHQVEFLSKVDRILVMEKGEITQEGTYEELLQFGTAFEQLVNAHQDSKTTLDSNVSNEGAMVQYQQPRLQQQGSDAEISTGNLPSVQLTQEEERELGGAGLKTYKDYVSVSRGWFLLVLIVLTQCVFVALQYLATYWLAATIQSRRFSVGIVVGVYAVMTTASCLFAYVRSLVAAHFGLKASREFFSGFMDSVFKAPMLFFDSTPTGRIMTRASSDLCILDFDIPFTMTFVISGTVEVAATVVVMIMVTWQVVLVAVPAVIGVLYIQRYYIASARELVRINGTTKAPVMHYAAESMLGVVTIRAFAATNRFIQKNLQLIDMDATMFFYTNAALEWVLLRVEAMQILVIVTSSILLVMLPAGSVAPGFLGLCLSYALTLSSAQVFLTRFYSNLENYMISVERIKQFMNLPSEPPAIISDRRPAPSWPSEGKINLENLRVKYRENAPTVLRGITCTFAAGNKIGVVGRTGSGKTTLLSALFRLIDPSGGRILIDDVDICTIGLKDLRMKLSIIPQEPTLFRGSVRSNVDPLGLYTDQDIWEALDKCQLKKTISVLPELLEAPVSDDGENWSAGQRQLFCLAPRVIKQEFSGCTVITIAHRVPTVTDSDMVMVLSYGISICLYALLKLCRGYIFTNGQNNFFVAGKLIEYDRPSRLMENEDSSFFKLVSEYWSNYK